MKEIDFIPYWYKAGQKKKAIYRRQYMIVGGLFAILATLSFVTGQMLSDSRAAVRGGSMGADEQAILAEYDLLSKQIKAFQERRDVLDRVRPHADVAAVLAEISHLAGERIVLRELTLAAESLSPAGPEVPRIVLGSGAGKAKVSALPRGDERFKIVLEGITADVPDVAELIARLEESGYFRQIVPRYSRNSEIDGQRVAEFQIHCYLANYREP